MKSYVKIRKNAWGKEMEKSKEKPLKTY